MLSKPTNLFPKTGSQGLWGRFFVCLFFKLDCLEMEQILRSEGVALYDKGLAMLLATAHCPLHLKIPDEL